MALKVRRVGPAEARDPLLAESRALLELEPHPVSSSEIRRRARAGEPLDGLVAPAVAQYIASHGLYRAV